MAASLSVLEVLVLDPPGLSATKFNSKLFSVR